MLTEVEYWDLEVSMSTLDSDSLATAVTIVVIALLRVAETVVEISMVSKVDV